MTVYVPPGLPAAKILRSAGIAISDAPAIDVLNNRRLRIVLINLMPDKPATEKHFASVLAAAGRPVELILVRPESHISKNASVEHMARFYQTWRQVKAGHIDGVIVTGAPVEMLPFEEVDYWQELTAIMVEIRRRNIPLLAICWAAQAALYHYHRVPKHILEKKAFGVFEQQVFQHGSPSVKDMGNHFACPVSRHTEVRWSDILHVPDLHVAAASDETGLCLVEERSANALYMFNHLEYGSRTLAREYWRDVANGSAIDVPSNLFAGDDPAGPIQNDWRKPGLSFFQNWTAIL